MIRSIFLLFALFLSVAAHAQDISPQDEALQSRLVSCVGDSVYWQTQAITNKRRADDLQKQLDALKKPPATPVK